MEEIELQKVDKGTTLAENLLNFVKNFSWLDVKEHTVRVLENWEFEEWETPFVAIVNGQIVGMTTIMKSDYYPLPEIFPWISTLFVSEDYRGNRISGKLIDFANQYAKSIGFDKTYIPTEFIGLNSLYVIDYTKESAESVKAIVSDVESVENLPYMFIVSSGTVSTKYNTSSKICNALVEAMEKQANN